MFRKGLSTALSLLLLAALLPAGAMASSTLTPSFVELTMRVGESEMVDKEAFIPASPPVPLDVYFLVDTTGSFFDDLPQFKSAAPMIVSSLVGSGLDVHFGLGDFRDYPISPFGSSIDYAYLRHLDISSPTLDADMNGTPDILDAINGLTLGNGADTPESQLPALYQTATGAGQDLSGAGFPGASIPAGQQANFRAGATKLVILWTDAKFHLPGDAGSIPYPGPSMADTINELNARNIKVAGVGAGSAALTDLAQVASGTSTFAPAGGVDCDGNGTIDVAAGDPMVCQISTTGTGIAQAIVALAQAVALTADVSLVAVSDPLGQFAGASPAVYSGVDLKVDNHLSFTETFSCPDGSEHTTTDVLIGLKVGDSIMATQTVRVNCEPAEIEVEIDTKPGSDPSSYGCASRGTIPVALLGSGGYDLTMVDLNSIRYGKTGVEAEPFHKDRFGNVRAMWEDTNGDGLMDLVFHFRFADTGWTCDDIPAGDTAANLTATLTGLMTDGTPIIGQDILRLVSNN